MRNLSIIYLLFTLFVSLSCSKGHSLRNKIYIPYIISNRPDPLHIVYSGDWIVTNHLWTPLLDLKFDGSITGVLAEKWTKSIDGKVWTIQLRQNLKWSDGTPMTAEQIINSLQISKIGTSHTNLSNLIKSIEQNEKGQIVFHLKRNIPQFLEALTYSDWNIMHPSSLVKDKDGHYRVNNYSTVSGPFTLKDSVNSDTRKVVKKLSLKASTNYVFSKDIKFSEGEIVSFQECEELYADLNTISSLRLFKDSLTKECEEKLIQAGFEIYPSQPSWIVKADFTQKALSSIPLEQRLEIIKKIQEGIKLEAVNVGSIRATGLRAPHLYGSLSEDEFDKYLSQIKTEGNFKKIKLKIISMELWAKWKSFTWLVDTLKSLGYEVETHTSNMQEFYGLFASGKINSDYDLLFLPLGVGDIDPDGSWRIAQRYFYSKFINSDELESAYLEEDYNLRGNRYKNFALKLIQNAAYIPLVMNVDYIGIHKDFKIKEGTALRNGTSLFDLE